jgi:hypothetical protein
LTCIEGKLKTIAHLRWDGKKRPVVSRFDGLNLIGGRPATHPPFREVCIGPL